MLFEHITSKTNDKIKRVCLLNHSASARKEQGAFVLEGLRLCRDAAQNGIAISEMYFTESVYKKHTEDVELLLSKSQKGYCVSAEVMNKISDTESSQGIVCLIDFDALDEHNNIDCKGKYIACENLNDPSNLGAIARTAEALGLSGLILIGNCCDAYNPKSLRASMGALLRLPTFKFSTPDDINSECKTQNMRLVGSVVRGQSVEIKSFDFKSGDIVVIGNEANGMTDELISMCDSCVTIEIKGRAESFNAAVAASIIMWELSAE